MKTFSSNIFKTQKEIAAELGLSDRTFYNRCKEKGLELGRKLLSPKEQEMIFEALEVKFQKAKEALV